MAGLMALTRSEMHARAIVFVATGGVPALFEARYEAWLTSPEPDVQRAAMGARHPD
jgi:hypothetical protein